MNTPPPINVEDVFDVAAALRRGERSAYLDAACAGRPAVRERIERLLTAHDATEFMQTAPPRNPELEAQLAALKPERSGDRIGHYKLLEQIGEGGFGAVWAAEQEQPIQRRVALKIIKLGMNTKEVIARFEQERQALAMMDHPNIARVFDAGATEWGRPFFVMELVRGIRIHDYCEQVNLPTRERLKLFISVCQAVQHAHQKGIIHRDLKPSNVMVTMQDDVPVPKIIDFGVAKATQPRLGDLTVYTQFQQMIGTPMYMSPEQAEMGGLDIDTRSDIYSLGVLLYELLTGRTPFDAKSLLKQGLDEIRRIIREQEPPRPSTALSTMEPEVRTNVARRQQADAGKLMGLLRGDLDWIVMKSLEKDRTRRYSTANGLAMDILRYLANEPVLARPPSRVYRMRRFARRHKTGVLSAAGVAMALVVGTSVSIWQAVRANSALAQLRNTAPAFAAQARELVIAEDFKQAITKLSYAIQLQKDSVEYLRERANLLQSQRRLAEAAVDFRRILALSPGDGGARANAELCERLANGPRGPGGELPRASLAELYGAMTAERRPPAQIMPIARMLGRENEIMREYWLNRLRSLPNASRKPIEERLLSGESGRLELDLSGTGIADISSLRTMPLANLNLAGCKELRSIDALRGMPLRSVDLSRTAVASVGPLAEAFGLEELDLSDTPVAQLSALRGLHLHTVRLGRSEVSDLSALRGMPLANLELAHTRVNDLTPLEGTPLKTLDCSYTAIESFAPLAGLPLEQLAAQGVRIGDLSFARDLPLKALVLTGAHEVRNLQVLRNIPTLESLLLPGNPLELPEDEIAAIESLKTHPALRRISTTLPEGSTAHSAGAPTNFWREWDATMKWWRALRKAGIKVKADPQPGDTWKVSVQGEPLRDLTVFAESNISWLNITGCGGVSDLTPLRGLPLTLLSMGHTAVADLSPLSGMDLHALWMAGTRVTNLSPLRGLPLTTLFMDGCPLLTDLSPLSDIPTLENILLPENAADVSKLQDLPNLRRISYTFDSKTGQPATATADFWREYHDLSWLRALRNNGTAISVTQFGNGTWGLLVHDKAFADVSVLAGARISSLSLSGTKVADIRPLTALPLRGLRLDGTAVTDVSALARIPTLESVVLPRNAAGVSGLHALLALKRIAFEIDASGAPALDAAAFWAAHAQQDR